MSRGHPCYTHLVALVSKGNPSLCSPLPLPVTVLRQVLAANFRPVVGAPVSVIPDGGVQTLHVHVTWKENWLILYTCSSIERHLVLGIPSSNCSGLQHGSSDGEEAS
eukprot:1139251-Pelagomonas_calceolata.AAC.7